MKLRLKAQARVDLLAIRSWGDDRWGAVRTDDYLDALITALERIDAHPMMGRSREALAAGLRSIKHRDHIVSYTIEDERAVFLRVLHERRDHAAISFADAMEWGD